MLAGDILRVCPLRERKQSDQRPADHSPSLDRGLVDCRGTIHDILPPESEQGFASKPCPWQFRSVRTGSGDFAHRLSFETRPCCGRYAALRGVSSEPGLQAKMKPRPPSSAVRRSGDKVPRRPATRSTATDRTRSDRPPSNPVGRDSCHLWRDVAPDGSTMKLSRRRSRTRRRCSRSIRSCCRSTGGPRSPA